MTFVRSLDFENLRYFYFFYCFLAVIKKCSFVDIRIVPLMKFLIGNLKYVLLIAVQRRRNAQRIGGNSHLIAMTAQDMTSTASLSNHSVVRTAVQRRTAT